MHAESPRLYCRVLRGFEGGGQTHRPGDIVEVSTWRNHPSLIDNRYLVVCQPDGETNAAPRGRKETAHA